VITDKIVKKDADDGQGVSETKSIFNLIITTY